LKCNAEVLDIILSNSFTIFIHNRGDRSEHSMCCPFTESDRWVCACKESVHYRSWTLGGCLVWDALPSWSAWLAVTLILVDSFLVECMVYDCWDFPILVPDIVAVCLLEWLVGFCLERLMEYGLTAPRKLKGVRRQPWAWIGGS
jgi:hypothetical protein